MQTNVRYEWKLLFSYIFTTRHSDYENGVAVYSKILFLEHPCLYANWRIRQERSFFCGSVGKTIFQC